jgi:hypothetical protein
MEDRATVPQHIRDQIQELRTETKPSGAWINKETRGTTQHMMMLEANHDGFQKGNIKLQGYFGFLHKEP